MKIQKSVAHRDVDTREHLHVPVFLTLPISAPEGSLIYLRPTGASNGTLQYYANGAWVTVTPSSGVTPPDQSVLTNLGPNFSLVSDGVGPAMSIKSLTSSGTVVLTEPVPGTIVVSAGGPPTANATNIGTGASLVADGIGPNIGLRGITPGPGVTIGFNPTNLLISVGSALTGDLSINDGGEGVSLIADGQGPDMVLKPLVAFPGITITETATEIAITQTADGDLSGITITSTGAGAGNLVADGTLPGLALKSIVGGTNVTVTQTGVPVNTIVLSTPINLASESVTGLSLVDTTAGAPPNYRLKSIAFPSVGQNSVPSFVEVNAPKYVNLAGNIFPGGTYNLNWNMIYLADATATPPTLQVLPAPGGYLEWVITETSPIPLFRSFEFDIGGGVVTTYVTFVNSKTVKDIPVSVFHYAFVYPVGDGTSFLRPLPEEAQFYPGDTVTYNVTRVAPPNGTAGAVSYLIRTPAAGFGSLIYGHRCSMKF